MKNIIIKIKLKLINYVQEKHNKYSHIFNICIERIIFQDSIYDDIINEKFREMLQDISII